MQLSSSICYSCRLLMQLYHQHEAQHSRRIYNTALKQRNIQWMPLQFREPLNLSAAEQQNYATCTSYTCNFTTNAKELMSRRIYNTALKHKNIQWMLLQFREPLNLSAAEQHNYATCTSYTCNFTTNANQLILINDTISKTKNATRYNVHFTRCFIPVQRNILTLLRKYSYSSSTSSLPEEARDDNAAECGTCNKKIDRHTRISKTSYKGQATAIIRCLWIIPNRRQGKVWFSETFLFHI